MLAVKKKEEPKAKEKMQPTLVTSGDGPFGGRVEVHTLQVRGWRQIFFFSSFSHCEATGAMARRGPRGFHQEHQPARLVV